MNILFICRENLQRSPTAEDMLRDMAGDKVKVRSAGINRTANRIVDRELLEWADIAYVMTERIEERMRREFPGEMGDAKIRVLGIPDRYFRGEPRLKRRLLKEFSQDSYLARYVKEEDFEKVEGE